MPQRLITGLTFPDATTDPPLLRFDAALVNKLARAIDNNDGEWPQGFGEVKIDQEGFVLGGVHRTRAAAKRGLTKVPCKVIHCTNAQERLIVAIEDNAEHGKPWTPKEEAQITIIAERYGLQRVEIATALRVPLAVVERKPIVNVVRRNASGDNVTVGRTYIPRPVRKSMKNRDTVTEEEAALFNSFLTPHPAGIHLAEILRISAANALPNLDLDLYALAREAITVLGAWIERDEGLLNEGEAA